METEQIKRPRRTSVEIKLLLGEFKHSDMDAGEFCKAHGITEGVFYKWKARYLNKPSAKQNEFITLQPAMITDAVLFAEVKGIKLYQAVTASYLKELLA